MATPYRHFMPSIEILGNDLRTLREREQFFVSPTAGRKPKDRMGQVESLIIKLRKQYLSVPEIKTHLDALELDVEREYDLPGTQAGWWRLVCLDAHGRLLASNGCLGWN